MNDITIPITSVRPPNPSAVGRFVPSTLRRGGSYLPIIIEQGGTIHEIPLTIAVGGFLHERNAFRTAAYYSRLSNRDNRLYVK